MDRADLERWGRDTAKNRYGSVEKEKEPPAKKGDDEGLINQEVIPQLSPLYQKPQSREDRQGPKYDNDVPNNWLRGMGPGEATGKPGFDHSNPAKRR